MRTWEGDLKKELEDPEWAALFANVQAESAQELLKCGVIKSLDSTSLTGKTVYSKE